jgi:hypothetical protein
MNRSAWLVALAASAIAAAAACNARTIPIEDLGVQASALFANGTPCAGPTQCTSGFCVDAVCCDTACGGGARDLLSCSNLYGVVPGLVDGTCTALTPGDACGSLTSVNPCQWRGTTVNNGNNCPNPPGGAVACFPCGGPEDCSAAYPVCLDNACVQCDGNHGGGTAAPCPASAPVCSNGQCLACTADDQSACTGTTPACNVVEGSCAACNGDNASGATRACPTAAAPACLDSGACGECSATNSTACTGTTPACNTAANTCAACNGDHGTGAAQACPTAANPYCTGTGACGKCATNDDCVGHAGGPLCNLISGACGAGCAVDADCAMTEWCAGGVCTTKTANGDPLPSGAPINGTCNVDNGARVCASGACDPGDNLCGLPNSGTCGPPPNDDVCRSGTCFAADNRCGHPAGEACQSAGDCRSAICAPNDTCGNCANDAACGGAASGQVCDDVTKTCKAGCRGMAGNGCAGAQVCTSTDSTIGACVQCASDSDCGGLASGEVCNPATSTCQPGCRGEGGNGCPANQTCTSADGTIGVCEGCQADSDCGGPTSGRVCSPAQQCQVGCRGTGGNSCPAGQTCSSTTDAIGACAPTETDAGTDGGVDAGADAGGSACTSDAECGGATSGRICDQASGQCTEGCRGEGGNGCAPGRVCSSTTSAAGTCAAPASGVSDDGSLEGGGLSCATTPGQSQRGGSVAWLVLGMGLVLGAARRRRSA